LPFDPDRKQGSPLGISTCLTVQGEQPIKRATPLISSGAPSSSCGAITSLQLRALLRAAVPEGFSENPQYRLAVLHVVEVRLMSVVSSSSPSHSPNRPLHQPLQRMRQVRVDPPEHSEHQQQRNQLTQDVWIDQDGMEESEQQYDRHRHECDSWYEPENGAEEAHRQRRPGLWLAQVAGAAPRAHLRAPRIRMQPRAEPQVETPSAGFAEQRGSGREMLAMSAVPHGGWIK